MAKKKNTNFTILAPYPVDSRMKVATYAELDAIPVKYNHMKTHVEDEDKDYKYYSATNTWVEVTFDGTVSWGDIQGDINNQTDLINKFNNYALANHTHPPQTPPAHTHTEAQIIDLNKYTQAEVDALVAGKTEMGTGILVGGNLTLESDTEISITAGEAVFAFWDAVVPYVAPNTFRVSFDEILLYTVQNITEGDSTTIALQYDDILDEVSITEFTGRIPNSGRRDLVVLGTVHHRNRTTIESVTNDSVPLLYEANQLFDVMQGLSNFNVHGNKYSSSGNNLNIRRSFGECIIRGINSQTDDPHTKVLAGEFPVTFFYNTVNDIIEPSTQNIDPNNYDDGSVTPVPADKWTIQRVYLLPDGRTEILYGQNLYDTKLEALSRVDTDDFSTPTYYLRNGILRAHIVVKQGATDLSDMDEAEIVEVSKFGVALRRFPDGVAPTLQESYDISNSPQITTSSTKGPLVIKNGQSADTESIFKGLNISGSDTFRVLGSGSIFSNALTANRILGSDASKNIVGLDTSTYPSLTELSYVKGVTSGIQGQIDGIGMTYNTVIRGIQAVATTKYALKTNFKHEGGSGWTDADADAYIRNFHIVGDEIRCYIAKDYYYANGPFRPGEPFENCTHYYDYDGKWFKTGFQDFRGNINIVELILPKLTGDSTNVFENCTALEKAILPRLSTLHFKGCSSLAKVDFEYAHTILGNGFTGCSNLPATLTLPNVTLAGGEDMLKGSSISTINLPELTTLNGNALRDWGGVNFWAPKLRSIPTASGTFHNANNIVELDFPFCTEVRGTARLFEMDSVEIINLPKCKAFGSDDATDDGMWTGGSVSGCVLRINKYLRTSNAGSENANITAAKSAGVKVVWVDDYNNEVGIREENNSVNTAYTLNHLDFTDWKITMTGDTTFSDSNLPTGGETKEFTIKLTGEYVPTFPAYWDFVGDSYDGSVWNFIAVQIHNGNSGTEEVTAFLSNM